MSTASVTAERNVLAACCQSAPALKAARSLLAVEDFYEPRNQIVFAAASCLADRDLPVEFASVLGELSRMSALTRAGGAQYLAELAQIPVVAASLGYYAQLMREATQRRTAVKIGTRIAQGAGEIPDLDDLLQHLASQLIDLTVLVDAPSLTAAVTEMSEWADFWAEPDGLDDWVVPDLVERQDVFLLLGAEGGGKSWLSRQFCLAIALGLHPLRPSVRIAPRNTLLVDLENSKSMLRRQSRGMGIALSKLADGGYGEGWVWRRPEGLNLRRPADAKLLERAVDMTQPAFLAVGPLYKLFARDGADWETAAGETRVVLDRIRERHNCALWIEHHMPKGDGKDRPQTPYGSSEWMRWASHGRVIQRTGQNAYKLASTFRTDRDPRDFPVGLTRGGELPWTAIWDPAELEYLSKGDIE